MTRPGPTADKAEWRRWARTAWGEVDTTAVSSAVVAAVADSGLVTETSRVVLFLPMDGELDLTPLASDVSALVTRTPDEGVLTVHPFDSRRETHPFGFDQPIADADAVPATDVDAVVVPGLAFDRRGRRLGRGAGHFDRFLARLSPGALRIGVAPSNLVVDELPDAPHDVAMTHLATEDGLVAVGSLAAVDDLETRTRAWIDGDPDPATRDELEALLAAGDLDELEERMGRSLAFGTAGIRGAVEAGSNRMNRAVVIRTTRGLADVMLAAGDVDHVVLGFDGRTSSRTFAADAIGVLTAAGIPVRFFPEVAPTPLVAFAARVTGATAAVIVTASHNPPRDNGYKVYAANAAQIVPPIDGEIGAAIEAVGPASDVPRLEGVFEGEVALAEPLGGEIEAAYLDEMLRFRGTPPPGEPVRIVYSAMHGVGGALMVRALAAAGHDDVLPVPEQFEPDGRFPTVDFPNPEEPGALDLAEALATAEDADLVVANDPDADRLAVVVRDERGRLRALSGNQIGVLLADAALRRWDGPGRPLVVNSIVSSPMLGAVAEHHGAAYATTLTGFKWIANAALDLAADGLAFVLGYEEALGYSVGPAVRDKDGISAAVWFADLAAEMKAEGRTIIDCLEALYRRDGLWVSDQVSVVRPGTEGAAEIAAAMRLLESSPPTVLGGREVVDAVDYGVGADERPRYLPATSLVAYHLADGSRVLVRPSGTEPKLKIYADVRGQVADGDEVAAAESAALDVARQAAADLATHLGF